MHYKGLLLRDSCEQVYQTPFQRPSAARAYRAHSSVNLKSPLLRVLCLETPGSVSGLRCRPIYLSAGALPALVSTVTRAARGLRPAAQLGHYRGPAANSAKKPAIPPANANLARYDK